MEIKSRLKKNIIRLMVHIGYFISLFIIGLILTYIVTWIALRIMPNSNLNEIITWGGIFVFVTVSLIDTILVFSGRASPAIFLLVLPFALFLVIICTIKYAFEKMPIKTIFESMKDIFKAELVVDSNDNAINSIANGLCRRYH
jgi:Cation transport ATPase